MNHSATLSQTPVDPIKIRPVSKMEYPVLREMEITTFSETFSEFNTEENMSRYIHESFSEEQVQKELANEHTSFFFAEWEGNPAGYLKINIPPAQTDIQDPDSIEIERIYVYRQLKGKRIGLALMDHALNICRTKGLRYAWLGVWEKNTAAIDFYTKYGFCVFSEHTFILGDDVQKDLLMRKDC